MLLQVQQVLQVQLALQHRGLQPEQGQPWVQEQEQPWVQEQLQEVDQQGRQLVVGQQAQHRLPLDLYHALPNLRYSLNLFELQFFLSGSYLFAALQ